MAVRQVTVNLTNTPGQLSIVSDLMGEAGINILALNVATAFGDGLMRFIATDPDQAHRILADKGYEVASDTVLACQTPHHAGGLNAILKPLKEAEINVDYIYPCIGSLANESTVLIIGVSDLPTAVEALKKNWILMVGDELYRQ